MRWRELPADKKTLLEAFDGYAGLRNALSKIAVDRSEWAGIPMPVDGAQLVIEPSYPGGSKLMAMCHEPETDTEDTLPDGDRGWEMRSRFYSFHHRSDIVTMQKNGRVSWGKRPRVNHIAYDMHVLSVADAWGLEQEQRALQLLGKLVRHRQLKQYLLTGMFMEKSERSGVHYIFRKLKPTLACSFNGGSGRLQGQGLSILAALCMHPIGYYADSWAGVMTPTDDVVAHLALMRGDEHMFWRRCNQHPAWAPEAGCG